jgi:hypothetical protein
MSFSLQLQIINPLSLCEFADPEMLAAQSSGISIDESIECLESSSESQVHIPSHSTGFQI